MAIPIYFQHLIWASFSNTFRPLPEEVNPMNAGMRKVYQGMGDAFSPPEILFTQRDFIYAKHLGLPLDF
ncbi:MAG: hypothetical protein KDI34_08505 [Halioglobus sp.]|nr:hypothetical protein [Halioglobus sp.]